VRRQEVGPVLVAGFLQDGEVAAVDDPQPAGTGGDDEIPEIPFEFGGAAGEIQRLDVGTPGDEANDRSDGFRRHFLAASGPA
jgi:hypothetical protein